MERLNEFKEGVKEGLNNSMQEISRQVENASKGVEDVIDNFSRPETVSSAAPANFLQTNTIVAKFAFLLLVLIVFVFLINLGIQLVGYFTQPSKSPYVIYGMIDGRNGVVITQNPKLADSTTVLRSSNQRGGVEFTWSVWVNITGNNTQTTPTYQNIFNKGDGNYDKTTGISLVNNAPGLYFKSTGDSTNNTINTLHIVMDTESEQEQPSTMDITNIPYNKWVNIVLRLKNTIFDVYVNGTNSGRMVLPAVPKQNYSDINVCQNGGFIGNLSNLRYYDHALSIIAINMIVLRGPSTTTSSIALSSAKSNAYYLSDLWYSSKA